MHAYGTAELGNTIVVVSKHLGAVMQPYAMIETSTTMLRAILASHRGTQNHFRAVGAPFYFCVHKHTQGLHTNTRYVDWVRGREKKRKCPLLLRLTCYINQLECNT